MTISKGAIGNLINRYRAVLTKCHLLNVFGSLAVAGMLILGGACVAGASPAEKRLIVNAGESATISSDISGQTSTANGGAAFNNGGTLGIDSGVKFENNTAKNGGAIYNSGTLNIAPGTEFNKNKATNLGGAIVITGGANVTTNKASFTENSGNSDWNDADYSYGGAIFLEGTTKDHTNPDCEYKDTGSTFTKNSSEYGGALSVGHGGTVKSVYLEGTKFISNSAEKGGAIDFSNSLDTKISNVTFDQNSATQNGGAIRLTASDITLQKGTVFTNNTAQNGGAVSLYSNPNDIITIDAGVIFGGEKKGNIASGNGGALYSHFGQIHDGGAQYVNNKAQNGGAIYLATNVGQARAHTFANSVFTGNTATDKGGAIYAANGSGLQFNYVQNALISGNNTTGENSSGGFLYLDGSSSASFDIAQNAALTIGATGATGQMDTIAGTADASLIKKGSGTMLVNSSLNDFSGSVAIQGGYFDVTSPWTIAGPVTLSAGTLSGGLTAGATQRNALDFTFASGGTLTLSGTGILQTSTKQVFTTALDAEGTNKDATGLNATGEKITFTGGALALTDDLYNLDYVKSTEEFVGSTGVVMLGKLVGATPAGSVDIKDLYGIGATLTQVEATTEGDLVVGSLSTATGTAAHANDLGVKTLDLGHSGTRVTVTNEHALTLVGDGGSLVKTGTAQQPVTLAIGDATQSGVLNLGVSGLANSGGTLNGEVQVAAGSQANVKSGTFTIEGAGITSAGVVKVDSGSSLTSKITLADGILNVSGATHIPTLTATSDSFIQVGDQGNAGRTVIASANLNGANLFLDPVWSGTSTIDTASHAVIGGNMVNGRLTVGQNSLLVLGDSSTDWALKAFADTGLTWGPSGVTAALALRTPQTLDAGLGGITVDGAMTTGSVTYATPNNAIFANGSLFMVDAAAAAGSNTALTGSGTLTVADTARLTLVNAQSGQTYNLTQFGSNAVTATGWQGSNLVLNRLLSGTLTDSNGKLSLATTTNAAAYKTVIPNTLNSMMIGGLNDVNSANAGIAFLSRAFEPTYLPDDKAVVPTVDGAAQLSVAGGVQASTMRTALAPTRSVQDHLSLAGAEQTSMRKDGLSIWFDGMFGADRARGFSGGSVNTGYNSDFQGAIIGGDYTFSNFRAGIALNVGTGDTRSHGGFNKTKNDFDFWGISAYGSWTMDNLNIIGDFGYSAADNTVKQDTPASMGIGQLKADIDSSVLTAGLRAEYLLHTDLMDILPHAGVRYLGITTDKYTTKSAAGDVFHTDKDLQHVWQLPVGVSLSKTFTTDSGWSLTPKADLSVVPTVGDTKAKLDVRVPGVNVTDGISRRVIDGTSFDGVFGIQAAKDNLAVGLNYNIQASEHVTGHGVTASFIYKF